MGQTFKHSSNIMRIYLTLCLIAGLFRGGRATLEKGNLKDDGILELNSLPNYFREIKGWREFYDATRHLDYVHDPDEKLECIEARSGEIESHHRMLLLYENGELRGFMQYDHSTDPTCFFIYAIFAYPFRKGYGKLLMEYAQQMVRKDPNLQKIELIADGGSETFYKAMGFHAKIERRRMCGLECKHFLNDTSYWYPNAAGKCDGSCKFCSTEPCRSCDCFGCLLKPIGDFGLRKFKGPKPKDIQDYKQTPLETMLRDFEVFLGEEGREHVLALGIKPKKWGRCVAAYKRIKQDTRYPGWIICSRLVAEERARELE